MRLQGSRAFVDLAVIGQTRGARNVWGQGLLVLAVGIGNIANGRSHQWQMGTARARTIDEWGWGHQTVAMRDGGGQCHYP